MDTPYNNDPLPGTPDEQYLNTLCSASASEASRQQPSRRSSPLPLPRASASESARAKFEARRAARLTSEFNKEQGQAAASEPVGPARASSPPRRRSPRLPARSAPSAAGSVRSRTGATAPQSSLRRWACQRRTLRRCRAPTWQLYWRCCCQPTRPACAGCMTGRTRPPASRP